MATRADLPISEIPRTAAAPERLPPLVVALDSNLHVRAHANCLQCGYDLFQLHIRAVCPECGADVMRSICAPSLLNQDPVWLTGVSRAFRTMLLARVCFLLTTIAWGVQVGMTESLKTAMDVPLSLFVAGLFVGSFAPAMVVCNGLILPMSDWPGFGVIAFTLLHAWGQWTYATRPAHEIEPRRERLIRLGTRLFAALTGAQLLLLFVDWSLGINHYYVTIAVLTAASLSNLLFLAHSVKLSGRLNDWAGHATSSTLLLMSCFACGFMVIGLGTYPITGIFAFGAVSMFAGGCIHAVMGCVQLVWMCTISSSLHYGAELVRRVREES